MTVGVKPKGANARQINEEAGVEIVTFIKDIMRRRGRLPSQLAKDLGVSHPTVSRWLSGKDVPRTSSCRKLAEYSGLPLEKVFSLAGHLPSIARTAPVEWPEFREYAEQKYPGELDEDMITVIENLIECRRARRHSVVNSVGPLP